MFVIAKLLKIKVMTTAIKKENTDIYSDAGTQSKLTYNSIGEKKSAPGKNQSLIEGFSSRQQAEFDRGITIENYAKKKGINL
jgi:hypothetical protein